MFAANEEEADYLCQSLKGLDYVNHNWTGAGEHVFVVTPNGWQRFEALTRGGGSIERPVFVAMWFGNTGDKSTTEMRELYELGIRPAVRDAGYRVDRADDVEHNEWIMDQVLGMIRAAPFIVADFTGHRNGVYFEAGFARGLGKTVINCCKESELDKAHFDTKQLNHVLWNKPHDLKDRLCNRIKATVGQGPYHFEPDADNG